MDCRNQQVKIKKRSRYTFDLKKLNTNDFLRNDDDLILLQVLQIYLFKKKQKILFHVYKNTLYLFKLFILRNLLFLQCTCCVGGQQNGFAPGAYCFHGRGQKVGRVLESCVSGNLSQAKWGRFSLSNRSKNFFKSPNSFLVCGRYISSAAAAYRKWKWQSSGKEQLHHIVKTAKPTLAL